jgi:glucose-6-phosphate 1-dehydrogenase
MDIAFSTIELKDDTIIVVLGASGDLAKKKTVRAPSPENMTSID